MTMQWQYAEYSIPLPVVSDRPVTAAITLPVPMSSAVWDHMIGVLEAMRPAFVVAVEEDSEGDDATGCVAAT